MRYGEAAERASMERALERDDEATVAAIRRLDAVQQRGLDRVLHRFGARVDDEVPRRPYGRDAVQFGLQAER